MVRRRDKAQQRSSESTMTSTARGFFRDERGLTMPTMALCLLLSLALVFTGAQVYRVGSASAEVQDVADAAALSAEDQVAEFMIVAQFCDATILSLSITGIAVAGLGVAALCIPPTAALSEGLLQAARKVIETRDRFSERAASVLNKLQEALPFYAAACAAAVSAANNGDSLGSSYLGIAILVQGEGKTIEVGDSSEALSLFDDIDSQADTIRQQAREAEEAAKEANEAKERAFARDCGDDPSYCMYERAGHLAGMTGADNPKYNSVDTWSFSVALERAKVYYKRRLNSEAPAGSSVGERARSALRKNFYAYAVGSMRSAYVRETPDSFDAHFPRLPHNTSQMRTTSLYTAAIYPITQSEEGTAVFHAWVGCPKAAGASAYGSIAQMEAGEHLTCPSCEFTASSLGKVAAASTSIDNGFEYHYEAVAEEADRYQKAMERAAGPKRAVKGSVGGFLERLGQLAQSAMDKRIHPEPPGRYGAIAFVVNAASTSPSGAFSSVFASASGQLGPRAAISAATLVAERSDEGRTVLSSMLDGIRRDGGAVVGAAGFVLDTWSNILLGYSNGYDAVKNGIQDVLDSIPLVSASGLGSWASKRFTEVAESLGLEPADLNARKAVLVNSGHVAIHGEDDFSSGFLSFKQRVVSASSSATGLFSMVLNDAEREAIGQVEALGDRIEIASIELLGEDGPSIPITIPIPPPVKAQGIATIEGIFERLRSFQGSDGGDRIWQ